MVEMFVLVMITVFNYGASNSQTIGKFEHYGQCLQAEAAMSESEEVSPNARTFYRCFPKEKES